MTLTKALTIRTERFVEIYKKLWSFSFARYLFIRHFVYRRRQFKKKWFDTSCLVSVIRSIPKNILKTLTITMGCDMLGQPITAIKLHTMRWIHFWWCILISMQLPIFSWDFFNLLIYVKLIFLKNDHGFRILPFLIASEKAHAKVSGIFHQTHFWQSTTFIVSCCVDAMPYIYLLLMYVLN